MDQARRRRSGPKASKVACRALSLSICSCLLVLPLVGPSAVFGEDYAEEPDSLFDDLFDEEFDEEPLGYADPLESTNRGVFAFNRQVDEWMLDPVTEAYQWAAPKSVRNALSRMFRNLSSTKTLVNDFLQLEWMDAGVTGTRFVLNTTVGFIGLFDVAASMGLEAHDSDFGQTLALMGTPSGSYLVLPILGPGNVRDGIGMVIDGFFQPTYYILGPSNLILGPTEILLYSGSSGISTRERFFRDLKALEESSVDFYAAMRSGYYQRRVDEIWGRRKNHRTNGEPRYGDENESASGDTQEMLDAARDE
ncbi:MAG: hypothetical protein CL933_26150 [Deltaproteobacteria bacterium]|nr:hypothetical protein [Deltaproteobacteria bacterium]